MDFYKHLLWVSAVVLVVSFLRKDALPDPSQASREVLRMPVQAAVEKPPLTVRKGGATYVIRPLFTYDIAGMVVSFHHSASFDDFYHDQWKDYLNGVDVALIYDANVRSGIYRKYTFKSGSWTAFFQPRAGTSRADWAAFDNTCFSNNHLVTIDDRNTRAAMSFKVGDQVRIRGYLANYGSPDYPDARHTSTVRTDTGCEVILVEDITILKRANTGWRLMFGLSLAACVLALLGGLFAWYRDFNQRLETLKKEEAERV